MSDNQLKYLLITIGLIALAYFGWIDKSHVDKLLDIIGGAFK